MRRAIAAGVVAAGLLAPPAHACTRLPYDDGITVVRGCEPT